MVKLKLILFQNKLNWIKFDGGWKNINISAILHTLNGKSIFIEHDLREFNNNFFL